MSLPSGSTFGPYEILAPAGAGGMGEVYRARDTRLGREVALKVITAAFAQDPDRIARFRREAQVLASLNHPNIAAIYGLEESGETRALVMEYVPGPTLADRIAAGPIPVADALPIARQIADALESAHDKGIIHRDLKPANVKVTAEGHVKVLDFGLAKALEGDPAASDAASSPTLTLSATRTGMLLGTAAYMSPEQARGTPCDRRADVWSFGVVLYEMVVGKPPFRGESVSDILAGVLKTEPDWDALPADTPPAVRRLLRRCLIKDRKRRLPDIGVAKLEIDEPEAPSAMPVTAPLAPAPSRTLWIAVTAALAVSLAAISTLLWQSTRPVPRSMQRFDVAFEPPPSPGTQNGLLAVSADGARTAVLMRGADGLSRLYMRRFDQAETTPVPGTENARDPFFSPDGLWLGFQSVGVLKKVLVQGGAPVKICDAPDMRGASWGEDGQIVFTPDNRSPLFRVSADGGAPQPLTRFKPGEIAHRYPQVLPGAQAVLYTAGTTPNEFEDATIQIVYLKTGETKTIHRGGYSARYVSSGHLLWVHEGGLFAAAADLASAQLKSTPIPIIDNLVCMPVRSLAAYAVSPSGILLGITGSPDTANRSLYWVEPNGNPKRIIVSRGGILRPRLSPDGKQIASSLVEGAKSNLFVYDLDRDRMASITFSGLDSDPLWTPDGKHLVFRHGGFRSDAKVNLYWIRADGSSQPQPLFEPPESVTITSADAFSPDGKRLVISTVGGPTRQDLLMIPVDWSDPDHPKVGPLEPLIQTPNPESGASISADGRWLAYSSAEVGAEPDVYVQAFPPGAGKWKVSTARGRHPVWVTQTRQLLYQAADGRIMSVSYRVEGNSFFADQPVVWGGSTAGIIQRTFDVTADGKRIVTLLAIEEKDRPSTHLTYLLNFPDELRRRIPR